MLRASRFHSFVLKCEQSIILTGLPSSCFHVDGVFCVNREDEKNTEIGQEFKKVIIRN